MAITSEDVRTAADPIAVPPRSTPNSFNSGGVPSFCKIHPFTAARTKQNIPLPADITRTAKTFCAIRSAERVVYSGTSICARAKA